MQVTACGCETVTSPTTRYRAVTPHLSVFSHCIGLPVELTGAPLSVRVAYCIVVLLPLLLGWRLSVRLSEDASLRTFAHVRVIPLYVNMSFLPDFSATFPESPLPGLTPDVLRLMDAQLDELFSAYDMPLIEQMDEDENRRDPEPSSATGETTPAPLTAPSAIPEGDTPASSAAATSSRSSRSGGNQASPTSITAVAVTTSLMLMAALLTSTAPATSTTSRLPADTVTTSSRYPGTTPHVQEAPCAVGPAGDAPTTGIGRTPAVDSPEYEGALVPPDAPYITSVVRLPGQATLEDALPQQERPTSERQEQAHAPAPTSALATVSAGVSPAPASGSQHAGPRYTDYTGYMTMPPVQFREPPTNFPGASLGLATIHDDVVINGWDRRLLVEVDLPRTAPEFVSRALHVQHWQGYQVLLSAYQVIDYEQRQAPATFPLDVTHSRSMTYYAPPYVYRRMTFHRCCLHCGLRYDRHSHCIVCVARAIVEKRYGYCTASCEVCRAMGDSYARYRECRIRQLVHELRQNPGFTPNDFRRLPAGLHNQIYANQERIRIIRGNLRDLRRRPPTSVQEVEQCAAQLRETRNSRRRAQETPDMQSPPGVRRNLGPLESPVGADAASPVIGDAPKTPTRTSPAAESAAKRRKVTTTQRRTTTETGADIGAAGDAPDLNTSIVEVVHMDSQGRVLSHEQLAEMQHAPTVSTSSSSQREPVATLMTSPTRRSARRQCSSNTETSQATTPPFASLFSETSDDDDDFTVQYVQSPPSDGDSGNDTAAKGTCPETRKAATVPKARRGGSTSRGHYVPPHLRGGRTRPATATARTEDTSSLRRPDSDTSPGQLGRQPELATEADGVEDEEHRRHTTWSDVTAPRRSVVVRAPEPSGVFARNTRQRRTVRMRRVCTREMIEEQVDVVETTPVMENEAIRQELLDDYRRRCAERGLPPQDIDEGAAMILDLIGGAPARASSAAIETPPQSQGTTTNSTSGQLAGPVVPYNRRPAESAPVVVMDRLSSDAVEQARRTLHNLLECHPVTSRTVHRRRTIETTETTVVTSETTTSTASTATTSVGVQAALPGRQALTVTRSTDMEGYEGVPLINQSTQTSFSELVATPEVTAESQQSDTRNTTGTETADDATAVKLIDPAPTLAPTRDSVAVGNTDNVTAMTDDAADRVVVADLGGPSLPTRERLEPAADNSETRAESDVSRHLNVSEPTTAVPRDRNDDRPATMPDTQEPTEPVVADQGAHVPIIAPRLPPTNVSDVLRAALRSTLEGLLGADIRPEFAGGAVPLTITFQGPIHIHVNPGQAATATAPVTAATGTAPTSAPPVPTSSTSTTASTSGPPCDPRASRPTDH